MVNYSKKFINKLEKISSELRIEALEMIHKRGAGHPGGSLSAVEIITALFFSKMNISPGNKNLAERDRFILSKGHASATLYAVLSKKGFFPAKDLEMWGKINCHLQGHPDRNKTSGVEVSTGILGHGINIAAGILLASRLKKINFKVYVLIGDGETQAGVIWEGAMTAAKYKLNNLVVILDYNGVQLDGKISDIMPLEPIIDKWRSFNFEVLTIDGHDIRQILESFDEADRIQYKPIIIIARTTKGKGVSFMEDRHQWHGIAPNEKQFKKAKSEILKEINAIKKYQ